MKLKDLIVSLDELTSPLKEQVPSLEKVLRIKTDHINVWNLEELIEIDEMLKDNYQFMEFQDNSWVGFIRILLSKLFGIKKIAEENEDILLSLSQQKTLKVSLEMIICIGILPFISIGYIAPLEKQLSNKLDLFPKSELLVKNLYLLEFSIHGLMNLYESKLYHTMLISRHTGHLIAANLQLIYSTVNATLCSKYLKKLIENTYQPLVIQELMLLMGTKEIPKKLHRWLKKILTDRLTSKGGLLATIRAILDLSGDSKDSPRYWENVSVLARLLTASEHSSVYPELLELLKCQNSEYRKVAVVSLKLLAETRPEDCNKYFVSSLINPLITPSTESDLTTAISTIHYCCGIPAPWSVSPIIFQSGFTHLLRLYCKTRRSVSHLKLKMSDIAHSILADEKSNMKKIFDDTLFKKLDIAFYLGSEGGLYADVATDDSIDPENAADSILQLILTYDNPSVKFRFFKILIESVIENQEFSKQVIYTKLLSEISVDLDVQKCLGDNPYCLIPFIKCLLIVDNKFDDEIVCLGLMILGLMIDSRISEQSTDWNVFNTLIDPLQNFKSPSCETNVLANELYELILSHGVIRKREKKNKESSTSLTNALDEAINPMIPIRAHGLRELGKLIKAKNKEALRKADTILFMFKENLKDDDSYIYLSAVEGLASLASSLPDEVLMSLIDEYKSTKKCTENRLKVGEVLLKLGRLLNEMTIVYKKELISCFLIGCRDKDELMRTSSLSNLGELCKILSFRISSYIVEILECIKAIYETDKFLEPRRAAIMVLTLLFKGLGEGVLSDLQPLLLDIYRDLKNVYTNDRDDVTRLHAQMALEELKASTLTFLFPSKPLEKRIFILDPPM